MMIRILLIISFMFAGTKGFSQNDLIKAIVLINGTPYLVDVTAKGDITTTYQKVENYFKTSESHENILKRLIEGARPDGGPIVFYEQEAEPVPSFSEENQKPIDIGNEQYIGFSPDQALLLKPAVDQIRRITDSYQNGILSKVIITAYYFENYRSKSLSRNRAKAINDLMVAFGMPERQIERSTRPGTGGAKVDFVKIEFPN